MGGDIVNKVYTNVFYSLRHANTNYEILGYESTFHDLCIIAKKNKKIFMSRGLFNIRS